jgi:hypothetical protein
MKKSVCDLLKIILRGIPFLSKKRKRSFVRLAHGWIVFNGGSGKVGPNGV